MRVLHCIPSMAGGGAERQLTYLASELTRLGEDVHVAVASRGANWDRLVASGAVVHELHAAGSHDPRLLRQLVQIVRSIEPDIIQVWLRQMDVLGGTAALISRKPLVITERASELAYPPSMKHVLRSVVGRFTSAIVSNSGEGDRYWQRRTRKRTPRYVIPNAVPIYEIAAAPPVERSGNLVLFAGRLEPQKNIDNLLAALQQALSDDDFTVLCCGTGSLEGRMIAWIERHGLGRRITMMGYTDELWSLMKRASLFVSPSLFEGSPNVVLEAMACGCPLVVSDIPEHRELLDESTGALVDPRSATALAGAIRDTLRDRDAARQRADAAFVRVQRFSPAAIAQRYLDVYRELLAPPAAAARRASI